MTNATFTVELSDELEINTVYTAMLLLEEKLLAQSKAAQAEGLKEVEAFADNELQILWGAMCQFPSRKKS
jgi:hypothetical protein